MHPYPSAWYRHQTREITLPQIAEVLAQSTIAEIEILNKAQHCLSKNDSCYVKMILSDLKHPGSPSVNLTRLYGARVVKVDGVWFNGRKSL